MKKTKIFNYYLLMDSIHVCEKLDKVGNRNQQRLYKLERRPIELQSANNVPAASRQKNINKILDGLTSSSCIGMPEGKVPTSHIFLSEIMVLAPSPSIANIIFWCRSYWSSLSSFNINRPITFYQ